MLRCASRFRSAVLTVIVAAIPVMLTAQAQAQWKDAKTGKAVASGPVTGSIERDLRPGNLVYTTVLPDAGDRNRAFDPESGRNFVRDPLTCVWKDAKTGRPVASGPVTGSIERDLRPGNPVYTTVLPDAGDPNRAFDPESGRNFVRTPCPPTKTAKAAASPPPPAKPADGSVGMAAPLDREWAQLLALHNKVRADVGSPPLQWDPQLANDATAYARQRASGNSSGHASRAGRENSRENLSMGRLGETPVQMMQLWLDEKSNFIPGIFPNISKTGDWSKVGHYSQMIWGMTIYVGCGSATGVQWEYLVCRYSPPGNQDGKPVLASQSASAANYGWIDTKTGKPVTSYPVLPGPGEHPIGGGAYHYVIPNPGGKSAYDPDTQRNFAKDECGDWIDTKTGKKVTSYPVLPGPGEHPIGGDAYHYVIPNPGGKSAYDPDTGRNFAREPCPPK